MIEFDENLNPIEGGKPTGDDMPPLYQGPEEPIPPTNQPVSQPKPDTTPARPEQQFNQPSDQRPPTPPTPPTDKWQPQPPREPRGANFGVGLLWVVVIGLLGLTFFAITNPSQTTEADTSQPAGITVSGEGVAYAAPDIAKIRFGVQHTARTVTDVRNNLDSKIGDMKKQLEGLDVADKDIKTVEYSLYPERDYRRTPAYITGYTGRHTLEVTIRDLDKVNDIVDAITRVGVNDISNVTFDIDDSDEWIKEARSEAIKEAKDKAKDIAKDADVKLGKLVSIQENIGGGFEPYPYMYGRGGGEDAVASPSIEPGSQEIRVNVTLIYEIG